MAIDAANTNTGAIPLEPQLEAPGSDYPVGVTYTVAERNQRFWAIPLIGIVGKIIILIPHLLILGILQYAVNLAQLILWIPVLFTGHYPPWGYVLTGGYLRWNTRVTAFLVGLTDEYPPFTFRSVREDGRPFLTQVRFSIPEHHSRLWAIPLLGLAIKLVILIPHYIILSVLGLVSAVVSLVLWIPVLFGGRFPGWGYQVVGGTLRWSVRVLAFSYGLTDRYPPFAFD
jgi:hypothetical protein